MVNGSVDNRLQLRHGNVSNAVCRHESEVSDGCCVLFRPTVRAQPVELGIRRRSQLAACSICLRKRLAGRHTERAAVGEPE